MLREVMHEPEMKSKYKAEICYDLNFSTIKLFK